MFFNNNFMRMTIETKPLEISFVFIKPSSS